MVTASFGVTKKGKQILAEKKKGYNKISQGELLFPFLASYHLKISFKYLLLCIFHKIFFVLKYFGAKLP